MDIHNTVHSSSSTDLQGSSSDSLTPDTLDRRHFLRHGAVGGGLMVNFSIPLAASVSAAEAPAASGAAGGGEINAWVG